MSDLTELEAELATARLKHKEDAAQIVGLMNDRRGWPIAKLEAEVKQEKGHRIRYQSIVYAVCNLLDKWECRDVTRGQGVVVDEVVAAVTTLTLEKNEALDRAHKAEAEVKRLKDLVSKIGYWKPGEASQIVFGEIRDMVQDELDREVDETTDEAGDRIAELEEQNRNNVAGFEHEIEQLRKAGADAAGDAVTSHKACNRLEEEVEQLKRLIANAYDNGVHDGYHSTLIETGDMESKGIPADKAGADAAGDAKAEREPELFVDFRRSDHALRDMLKKYIAEIERLKAEVKRTKAAHVQGGDPEFLGRVVRKAWIEWAEEQRDPKPGWCVPWDKLTEPEREVDRRIGLAVANVCVSPDLLRVEAEVERLKAQIARMEHDGMGDPEEYIAELEAEIKRLQRAAMTK